MIRKYLSTVGVVVAIALAYGCGSDAALAPGEASRIGPSLAAKDPVERAPNGGPQGVARLDTDVVRQPSDTALINPGLDTVLVLKRPFYLAQDISESADIGPQGGEINIQQVGGKIDFPSGALKTHTHITMTAKAGWNVAYEFQPHGITFDKPVKVQQDLKFTTVYRTNEAKNLTAGYYAQDLNGVFVDPWKFFARVSELRHVALDQPANPRVVKFYVYHFSGYLMSSGFRGNGMGGNGDFGR